MVLSFRRRQFLIESFAVVIADPTVCRNAPVLRNTDLDDVDFIEIVLGGTEVLLSLGGESSCSSLFRMSAFTSA